MDTTKTNTSVPQITSPSTPPTPPSVTGDTRTQNNSVSIDGNNYTKLNKDEFLNALRPTLNPNATPEQLNALYDSFKAPNQVKAEQQQIQPEKPFNDQQQQNPYQQKSPEETELDTARAEYQKQAKTVQDTISNIQNGTIPLSAEEQAQIDGLKNSFQQLIQSQQLQNITASGSANIRGYQKGAAEYDPTFQAKTIGGIVSAGNQKVADLNTQMVAAVAKLTQSFKDDDIKAVKDAWSIYSDAATKRQDALRETINATNEAIKAAQKDQEKVTDEVNKIAQDAAKNGAPSDLINKISSSGSVSEAIAMAGDMLQSATGELGNYLQYKRETMAKGLTPMLYGSWREKEESRQSKLKASEAYSTAYNSTAGRAAAERDAEGLSGGVGTKFSATIDQASDFEPAKTQGTYKKELQGLIDRGDYKSAVLKIQNSVSKALTGENKTQFDAKVTALPAIDDLTAKLKAYADAGGDTGLLKGTTEKIYSKLGQVKDPAFKSLATDLRISLQKYRKDMSGAAFSEQEAKDYESVNPSGSNKLNLNLSILEGMKDNFTRQVDSTVQAKVGEGAKYIKEFSNARQNVDAYVLANPDKADEIAQAYSVPGATDADVLEYITYLHSK